MYLTEETHYIGTETRQYYVVPVAVTVYVYGVQCICVEHTLFYRGMRDTSS